MFTRRPTLALAVLLTFLIPTADLAHASRASDASDASDASHASELALEPAEPVEAPDVSTLDVAAAVGQQTQQGVHASCEAPIPSGRWNRRSSDDDWARGLYPARERYAGKLALTFDDGPHRTRTPIALDELASRGLSATFFLTGHSIRSSTYELVQRMVAEGHTLANHGWRHDTSMAQTHTDKAELEAYIASELELTQIRVDLALLAHSTQEFEAMDTRVFAGLSRFRHDRTQQLARMHGVRARHHALLSERGYTDDTRPYTLTWMRPPGGNPYLGRSSNAERQAFARVINTMAMKIVMWNGGSGDSDTKLSVAQREDPERVAETARKAARAGGIYVAHDRIEPAALRAMLDVVEHSGVEVVGLEGLWQTKLEGLCG